MIKARLTFNRSKRIIVIQLHSFTPCKSKSHVNELKEVWWYFLGCSQNVGWNNMNSTCFVFVPWNLSLTSTNGNKANFLSIQPKHHLLECTRKGDNSEPLNCLMTIFLCNAFTTQWEEHTNYIKLKISFFLLLAPPPLSLSYFQTACIPTWKLENNLYKSSRVHSLFTFFQEGTLSLVSMETARGQWWVSWPDHVTWRLLRDILKLAVRLCADYVLLKGK